MNDFTNQLSRSLPDILMGIVFLVIALVLGYVVKTLIVKGTRRLKLGRKLGDNEEDARNITELLGKLGFINPIQLVKQLLPTDVKDKKLTSVKLSHVSKQELPAVSKDSKFGFVKLTQWRKEEFPADTKDWKLGDIKSVS